MDRPAIDSEASRDRHALYEEWVRTISDPATAASEGVRQLVVHKALAEYEIAPLADGLWALRYRLEYRTGDYFGHSAPWVAYASRAECVAAFLDAARRHFGSHLLRTADASTQNLARTAILERLRANGLFGFIEPDVARMEQQ